MRTQKISLPLIIPCSALFLLFPHGVPGQSAASGAIPATAATQSVSTLPSAQPATSARPGTPAEVKWTGSLLSIRAGGQTLPEILRQVARSTGMKISGSAPAEPVFGTYGPAPVQQVMAALFDGLNVNMLLVNDTPVKPKELLLTARTGGATTPAVSQQEVSVNTDGSSDPSDANLLQTPHPGRHTSADSFQGAPQAVGAGFAPQVPLNDPTGNGNAATSTDSSGTPQSPNGVRTPEQIFEELRRRQQGASQ